MREMRFKNFLEREDKEKIELVSRVAENILKQLEVYYTKLFDVYFPLPRQVNDHEKFMEWREGCRAYERQLPEYEGRKFSIQSGKSSISGNLGGEYLDDRVHLYDSEFGKLHQDLRNFYHFPYEYNLRGSSLPSEKRKNAKIKKEAKLIHTKMMQVFEGKKETYLSTLFHEIVHLFDHIKLGSKFNKVSDTATDRLNKEVKIDPKSLNAIYNKIYMNNDIETNAWFLTNARKALKGQFPTFQDLLSNFKSHFANWWLVLTPDKQRKMINRLYQVYSS